MATLTIHTDIDCNIYVDTEHYCVVKATEACKIQFDKGVYWIECRCTTDNTISHDFDYKVADDSDDRFVNIFLLHQFRLNELKSKYDYVGEFAHGFAEVRHNNSLIGFIDSTYQFKYDDISVLNNDILSVKINGHYGVVNNGIEVIPIKYDSICMLGDKMLRLGLNDRFCLAKLNGAKVTPLKYRIIEYAMNDIYALYFDDWKFINYDINEVEMPHNVILYTTDDGASLVIDREIEVEDLSFYKISSEKAFGQSPLTHIICDNFGLIIFNHSVSIIGNYAFYHCSNIKNLTIPDGVISIGDYAFGNCTSLTSVTMPDSVTKIGDSAFLHCYCLKSITLPKNVTKIGEWAFGFCSHLSSITIPRSVKEIGPHAFCHCQSIKRVTIINGVTAIGSNAFYGCNGLTTITIPDSVTELGEGVFSCCKNIQEFKGKFTDDGGRCLINNNIIIAYAASSGTTYDIPEGVTRIADSVFTLCAILTSVTIPYSVTEIGNHAFAFCKSLSSITMPEGIKKIGYCAFERCKDLKSITIPKSVTNIGFGVFKSCASLQEVYCEATNPPCFHPLRSTSGLENLNCTIYVPRSSVDVYKVACGWIDCAPQIVGTDICGNISQMNNNTPHNNELWYTNSSPILGLRLFNPGNSSLKSFFGVDWISSSHKQGVGVITFDNDINMINGYYIFSWDLISIMIPNSVTSIDASAFANCSRLKKFKGKFAQDRGRCLIDNGKLITFAPADLKEYTIPQGVTTIGYRAFINRSRLIEVTIPEGVIEIECAAFASCSSLVNITIPESLVSIRDAAFHNCIKLKSVYCKGTTPPSLGMNVFKYQCFKYGNETEEILDCSIYVPRESVDKYKEAWREYAEHVCGYNYDDINNNRSVDNIL